MRIQINTDGNIKGGEGLEQHLDAVVEGALGHLMKRVTRVEVHLSDENAGKAGAADKRCLMEVRLEGLPPLAVKDEAANLHEAIAGAADKLKRSVEHTLGRLNDQ